MLSPDPDVMCNASFLDWLNEQPPEKEYDYVDIHDCLISQYFKYCGYTKVNCSPLTVSTGEFGRVELPNSWGEIARPIPISLDKLELHGSTFGHAQKRAKSLIG